MSDTPRTDAACDRALQGPLAAILPILRHKMQAMERELTTANSLRANSAVRSENTKMREAAHAFIAFVDNHSDVAAVIKWNGGTDQLKALKT